MAVYAWGFGKYGQLGTGHTSSAETPQLLRLPKTATPLYVSCGAHFTLVLCESGGSVEGAGPRSRELYACGWGKYGRLGTGSEEDHAHPTRVHLSEADISQISAGFWHACCLTSDGKLYAWGYNKSHNVLGLIKGASPLPPFEPSPVLVPLPLDGEMRFKFVSCGYNFTYAVGVDGSCWSWGTGGHGVLGHGDTLERTCPTKVDVSGGETISFVSCGYSHVAVVTDTGKLFTAGYGRDGALGLGRRSDQSRLCHVTSLDGIMVTRVSCSLGERHSHTLACTSDGVVYSWGDGYKGKLGLGDQESRERPTRIDPAHFGSESVTSVTCGGIHSAAVTREGSVYTWGCGSDGRLGHPEAKGHRYLFRSDVPRKVEGLTKNGISLDCSYYHTAVVIA